MNKQRIFHFQQFIYNFSLLNCIIVQTNSQKINLSQNLLSQKIIHNQLKISTVYKDIRNTYNYQNMNLKGKVTQPVGMKRKMSKNLLQIDKKQIQIQKPSQKVKQKIEQKQPIIDLQQQKQVQHGRKILFKEINLPQISEQNILSQSNKNNLLNWMENMYGIDDIKAFEAPVKEYELKHKKYSTLRKEEISTQLKNQIEVNPKSNRQTPRFTGQAQNDQYQQPIIAQKNYEYSNITQKQVLPSRLNLKGLKKKKKSQQISKDCIRLTLQYQDSSIKAVQQDQKQIDWLREKKSQQKHAQQKAKQECNFDENGELISLKKIKIKKQNKIVHPLVKILPQQEEASQSVKKPKKQYNLKLIQFKTPKQVYYNLDSVKVQSQTLQNDQILTCAKRSLPSSTSRVTLVQKLNQSRVTLQKSKKNRNQNRLEQLLKKGANKLQNVSMINSSNLATEANLSKNQDDVNYYDNSQFLPIKRNQNITSRFHIHSRVKDNKGNNSKPKSKFFPSIVFNNKKQCDQEEPYMKNSKSAFSSPKKQLLSTLDRSIGSPTPTTASKLSNVQINSLNNSSIGSIRNNNSGYFQSYQRKKKQQYMSGIIPVLF